MEAKVSKAQLEVWEWKEKAYAQIKDMPLEKAIEFIIQQAKPVAEELDKKRKLWKNYMQLQERSDMQITGRIIKDLKSHVIHIFKML